MISDHEVVQFCVESETQNRLAEAQTQSQFDGEASGVQARQNFVLIFTTFGSL